MFENFNLNESPSDKPTQQQQPSIDFFNEPAQQSTVSDSKPAENTNTEQQQAFMDFNTMQNMFATNMHNVMNPPPYQPQQPPMQLEQFNLHQSSPPTLNQPASQLNFSQQPVQQPMMQPPTQPATQPVSQTL